MGTVINESLNLHECLVPLQPTLSSSAYDIAVFVATIHNVVVSTSVVKEAVIIMLKS